MHCVKHIIWVIHEPRPGLLWKPLLAQLCCFGPWIFPTWMSQPNPSCTPATSSKRLLLPQLHDTHRRKPFLSLLQALPSTRRFPGPACCKLRLRPELKQQKSENKTIFSVVISLLLCFETHWHVWVRFFLLFKWTNLSYLTHMLHLWKSQLPNLLKIKSKASGSEQNRDEQAAFAQTAQKAKRLRKGISTRSVYSASELHLGCKMSRSAWLDLERAWSYAELQSPRCLGHEDNTEQLTVMLAHSCTTHHCWIWWSSWSAHPPPAFPASHRHRL